MRPLTAASLGHHGELQAALGKAEYLGQMRAVLAFAWLTAFPGQSPRFQIGHRLSHLDAVSAVLAVRLFAKNRR